MNRGAGTVLGRTVKAVGVFGLILLVAASTAMAANIGATSKKASSPIVIGVVSPMTGSLAVFGTSIVPAIQLAADQINKAGGVLGRQIKIEVADDTGTPAGAAAAAQRLMADHPVALLGEVISSFIPPIQPLLEQNHIPALFGGSADSLGAGIPGGSDWYYKVTVNTATVAAAFFKFAIAKKMNFSRVGIATTDDNIGHTYATAVTNLLKRYKHTAPVSVQYNCNTCTDWTSQITALKSANVTAVFQDANEPYTAGFIRQTKQFGLTAPLFMVQSAGYATFYDKLVDPSTMFGNYTVVDTNPSITSKNRAIVKFVKSYRKVAGGKDPSEIVPEWYASVFWLAHAIETAKSTKGDALQPILSKTHGFSKWHSYTMPGISFSCTARHACNNLTYIVTGTKTGNLQEVATYSSGKVTFAKKGK